MNTLKLAGQCGKLKCCLNYELDTYLDALKDIPDRVNSLQTELGVAKLQKTDIFKKIMWFSYPNTEDWIPLNVSRVKEIMEMNKNGKKPVNLKEDAVNMQPTVVVEKQHDYENVVGQDSLTRLDNKRSSRNKNQHRNQKNQKPMRATAPTTGKTPTAEETKDSSARPQNARRTKHRNNRNKKSNGKLPDNT